MDTVQIRLECLKLAHRTDLPPSEVVIRAMVYEAYIGSGNTEKSDNRPNDLTGRRGRPPSNKPA